MMMRSTAATSGISFLLTKEMALAFIDSFFYNGIFITFLLFQASPTAPYIYTQRSHLFGLVSFPESVKTRVGFLQKA
jgi:hypothetical protein